MSQSKQCPQCGATVPPDAPEGLCPNCVLKAGFKSEFASQTGTPATEGKSSANPFPPPAPAELAAHFPDLEILEFIGGGGMGLVYKARQKRLERLVALKILLPQNARDGAFAERFGREARALAMLGHPNIVAVYDFGQTSLALPTATAGQQATSSPSAAPLYYLLMEYVDGPTLREVLEAGKLSPAEALAIVPQICEALQYAHDSGVVHRDIKPGNILLDCRGRLKIADFGLAKLVGRPTQDVSLTGTGQVMGTPHYMAPEQLEHPQEVDHRADIYSLGVVFYQMLTGELPLGRFAPPSKKVAIDVRLDEVVLRSLEREPALRYQHAREMKTEVETIASGGSPAVLHPSARVADGGSSDQRALAQVRGPAIGLLATGILNWVLVPFLVVILMYLSMSYEGQNLPGFVYVTVLSVLGAILVVSSLMILGALKMKRLESYGLAIIASILAMIVSPGNLLGLAIGIWSLIALSQPEVRAAFRHRLASRTAGAGPAASSSGAVATWAVLVALVIFFGLGLLAWSAIQIRHPLDATAARTRVRRMLEGSEVRVDQGGEVMIIENPRPPAPAAKAKRPVIGQKSSGDQIVLEDPAIPDLKLQLQALKNRWAASEMPEFRVAVLYTGPQVTIPNLADGCLLEVDGVTWMLRHAEPGQTVHSVNTDLKPGTLRTYCFRFHRDQRGRDLSVLEMEGEKAINTYHLEAFDLKTETIDLKRRFALPPGKHTIRVGGRLFRSPDGPAPLLWSDSASIEIGGTASAAPFAFHVVPNPPTSNRKPNYPALAGKSNKPFASEAIRELAEKGPSAAQLPGADFAWFEVADPTILRGSMGALVGEYRGKKYVLLAAREPYAMLPKVEGPDAWSLSEVAVVPQRRREGQVIHSLEIQLDKRGGQLFGAFTKANPENGLALVVRGRVVFATTLFHEIGDKMQMTAASPKEVEELAKTLRGER